MGRAIVVPMKQMPPYGPAASYSARGNPWHDGYPFPLFKHLPPVR